jgi:hypothetical protein
MALDGVASSDTSGAFFSSGAFFHCKVLRHGCGSVHARVQYNTDLLINAATCFDLNCWPSSGSIFSMCRLCLKSITNISCTC